MLNSITRLHIQSFLLTISILFLRLFDNVMTPFDDS